MTGLYLGAILFSHLGIALMDARWRLAVWDKPRAALTVIAILTVLFISIDVLAIAYELYGIGESPALIGIHLAPHFPIEELFFILFLSHLSLVGYGAMWRLLNRTEGQQ
ncbi:lycopene cyclase domain-containing protein [Jonesia quinghaiensis]|uniref:lycopene cyclase domain-containing protein n=1 Tax=Jonesia quinghaiensis TaxID=262806 RepID=UPI0004295FB9|nr:lycopene cyclase domain-containing protein [Jonesia quinghaiensis]